MSDVKRYGRDPAGSMAIVESADGDYVLATDYDALAAELATVRVDWFNESIRADAATARAEAAEAKLAVWRAELSAVCLDVVGHYVNSQVVLAILNRKPTP